MNILYVIPNFNPKRGGDINVCVNLAREFIKKGHEVTILTTDFEIDNNYMNNIKEQGINVVYFKVLFNVGMFIYSPGMKKWLDRNISIFDIIHLHTFRAYQNIVIYRYSKRYKKPYILQAHGSVLPFFQKQTLKKLFDYIWGHKLLEGATKTIASTKIESEQYQKMGVPKNKIEIIPNGINLLEYHNLPKSGKFKEKYGIKNEEKIVLYLGRINKIKGLDLLIDSFSEVSKELNNVKLVIVGPDDGFLEYLKKTIMNLDLSDKIIFTGPLYGEKKIEALVNSDIFVLTSLYESFGNSVIEASACFLPIIVTEECAIKDIVNKHMGIVVRRDPKKLSDAILEIITNDELSKKYGLKGRKYVEDNFDYNKTIIKVEKVYLDVIMSY